MFPTQRDAVRRACMRAALSLVYAAGFCAAANQPTTTIALDIAGQERELQVKGGTVAEALRETGTTLAPLDRVTPALATALKPGLRIEVTRVRRVQLKVTSPLPFGRKYEYTEELRSGLRKTTSPGVPGEKELTYEVWEKNGKETVRKLIGERVVRPAQDEVVMIGARQSFVSRGMPRARKVLVMEATGYSPGPVSCGKYANGWTACGIRAQHGVVAVDPKVIPFGTRLYVEGYGYAVAADTGSAIKGYRIDLCHPTHEKALAVGRKKVKVYLLD